MSNLKKSLPALLIPRLWPAGRSDLRRRVGNLDAKKANGRRGIFLVGCPRSGTTLLQALLASHPAIRSFPESHYLRHIVGAPPSRCWDGAVYSVPFCWRRLRSELRVALGLSTRMPEAGKEDFFRDLPGEVQNSRSAQNEPARDEDQP